ncbi:MAG: carboxypeptidase regulatory-like domain-containing protein [Calditrichaeota bacterium]|nr:carboxypeptidase regulatory-like domain-containing protein [Calditrichota bacterium]
MRSLIFALLILTIPALIFAEVGKIGGLIRELYSGKPVEGVEVKLIPTNRTIVSDSSGTFLLDSVEVGEYSVIFSKIGYMQSVLPCVKVEPDSTTRLRIILEKIPPPVKDKLPPDEKKMHQKMRNK